MDKSINSGIRKPHIALSGSPKKHVSMTSVRALIKGTSRKSAGRHAAKKPSLFGRLHLPRHKVRRSNDNLRTALWLWCFPVGLSLMWRRSCTWKRDVKVGISVAMVAILAAVLFIPSPASKDSAVTGIQMVSGDRQVEIYGPPLPALIVPGYTHESTGSIIVDAVENNLHYVYAADGARCYHEYECKFAFASSQRLTVYEAYYLGFEPCGRCHPPVYTPGEQIGTIETKSADAASEVAGNT